MAEFLQYAHERKSIIYYDLNFRKAHAHEAIRLMPTVLENLEYADIVRGSDEDFLNLFGEQAGDRVYADHIQFYCDRLITTYGAKGVDLYTSRFKQHYDALAIEPQSTIGAGDNFNAGLIFGLLKEDVRLKDLTDLTPDSWERIIRHGMALAGEVCQSYDNYISTDFASRYLAANR